MAQQPERKMTERFLEAAMQIAEPKPGMYLRGVVCYLFWSVQGESDPAQVDVALTPHEEMEALFARVLLETVKNMKEDNGVIVARLQQVVERWDQD